MTVRFESRGLLGAAGQVSCAALSRRGSPRCFIACGCTLSEYDLSTLGVTAQAVLPSPPVHVVVLEETKAVVCFMNAGMLSVFVQAGGNPLFPLTTTTIPGAATPVSFAVSSPTRAIIAYVKKDSPSVWCAELNVTTAIAADAVHFFKLRSDIEGDQSKKPNILKTGLASVRGAVSSKKTDQISPVNQLISHPQRPLLAAAYQNGIVRVWEYVDKSIKAEMDVQLLSGEFVTSIVFHSSEEILLAATNTGRIATFRFRATVHSIGTPAIIPSSRYASKIHLRSMFLWAPVLNSHADKSQNSPYLLALAERSNDILVRKVDSLTGKVFRSTVYPDGILVDHRIQLSYPPRTIFQVEATTGLAVLFEPEARTVHLLEQVESGASPTGGKLTQAPGIVAAVETPFSSEPGSALEGKVHVHPHAIFIAGSSAFMYNLVDKRVLEIAGNLAPGRRRHVNIAYDGPTGEMMAAIISIHAEDSDTGTGNENAAAYSAEENWQWRYILLTRKGNATTTERWSASDLQDGRDAYFLGPPGNQDSILILSPLGTSVAIVSFGRQIPGRGVRRVKLPEGVIARRVFATPLADYQSVIYWVESKSFLCLSRNAQDSDGTEIDYEMDLSTKVSLRGKEAVLDIRWQRMPGNNRRVANFLGFALTTQRLLLFQDDLQPLSQFDLSLHLQSEEPLVNPTALWMGPTVVVCIGSSALAVTTGGHAELLCRFNQASGAAVLVAALPDRIIYLRYPGSSKKQFLLETKPIGSMSLLLRGFLALPTTRSGNQYAGKIRAILEDRSAYHASTGLMRALIASGLSPLAKGILHDQKELSAPIETAQLLTELDSLTQALFVLEAEYKELTNEASLHSGTELYRAFQSLCNHAFSVNDFKISSRCAHILGREGTLRAFVDREGGLEAIRVLSRYASQGSNHSLTDRLNFLEKKSESSSVATLDLMASLPGSIAPDSVAEDFQSTWTETCKIFAGSEEGNPAQVPPLSLSSMFHTIVSEVSEDFITLRAADEIREETFSSDNQERDKVKVQVVEAIEDSDTGRRDDADEGSQTAREQGDSKEQLRRDMLKVFQLVDSREMDAAEDLLRRCIDLLPEVEDLKPTQVVVHYLFFVRILSFIARGKMNLTQALNSERPNPGQIMAARMKLAHLGNTLTEIPFVIDRHKVRAILLTIGLHMDIGNFGTAAHGIQLVQGQVAPDKAAGLQTALATCTNNGFRNQNPLPQGMLTCFESLVPFQGPGGRCSACSAIFSPAVVNSVLGGIGSSCTYCRIGVVG